MLQALKVRIHDHEKLERVLLEHGGTFIKENQFIDTCFNVTKGNATLLRFAEKNGKFDVVSRDSIADLEDTRKELTEKYGVNKILKGARKEFTYKDFAITFNIIDDVGEFLIITSDGSQEVLLKEIFQIHNPEYITVPFNEL